MSVVTGQPVSDYVKLLKERREFKYVVIRHAIGRELYEFCRTRTEALESIKYDTLPCTVISSLDFIHKNED